MKLGTKIIISVVAPIFIMMLLPLLAVKLFPDWAGMGLWVVCFFAVNPLLVILLSIMAGTDIGKMWWVPIIIPIVFPLLFGVAIGEFVIDLYVYSAFYLPIGVLAMLGTYFGKKMALKKKFQEEEGV